MNPHLVVSICSVSGGGKTALATALHRSLPQSALFCFDDFDDSNVYPEDYYEWSRRGADITEFDCPGMKNAVDEEIQGGRAKQIILDFPFGRRHPRFADIIDLDVFIDIPLDVAMARRILRDNPGDSQKSSEEAWANLRDELACYLAKARHPYLDSYEAKDASDLILDGWRSLDDLKTEVLARIDSGQRIVCTSLDNTAQKRRSIPMPDPKAHELFQAIWRHEADSVRTILNVRPDLVDAWLTGDSWPNEFSGEAWDSRGFEAPRGLDPLAYASVLGSADCVDSLIAAGAGVESVSYGADMGWCTPLIQAAFQDKEEALFRLLRHGANPNAKGSAGSTALMTAAGHGRSGMVDALLAAGAEMTIHVAAALGDLQKVDRILGESSAWLEAKDSYRQATPLYHAAGANRVEVVKALAARGADLDTPDQFMQLPGWTPLFRAAFGACTDVVLALVELGADVNYVSPHARWKRPSGTSVLHAACYETETTPEVIGALLRNGADTQLTDSGGRRPVDVARDQSRDELVAVLKA